ncbi:MAG TPA: matrixin family metalloprotease [Blastocatellia bacterium]|nr:matrixin family metalloprotease [Blastocatellia bacterium]
MKKDKNSSKKRTSRQHFDLDIPELAPGQQHPELAKVQTYLGRAGYLKEAYSSSRLDTPTQKALKRFQRFRKLKQTGTTDPATVERLKQPKCGYPDQTKRPRLSGAMAAAAPAALAPSLSIGCDYRPKTTLTYTFVNRTSDLGPNLNRVNNAIARAFATWQAAIPINFVLVADDDTANFKIGWFSGSHDDGDDFDSIGGVIAHAFGPPPCGDPHAGLCHFDEAEVWGNNHSPAPRMFDLETQALHEIGHLLGLSHSNDPNSIMFTDYRFVTNVAERRRLSPDVLTAIQSIYGSRTPS